MKFHERLRSLGYSTYAGYLEGEHWKKFRTRYYKLKTPKTCRVCDSGDTQLHHVTYERLGCEKITDVVPLCREHHEAVHTWLKTWSKRVEQTHEAIEELKKSYKKRKVYTVKPREKGKSKPSIGLAYRTHYRQRITLLNKLALIKEVTPSQPLWKRWNEFKSGSSHELQMIYNEAKLFPSEIERKKSPKKRKKQPLIQPVKRDPSLPPSELQLGLRRLALGIKRQWRQ